MAVFWHCSHNGANVVSTNAVAKAQAPPDSAKPALPNNVSAEKVMPSKSAPISTASNDRLAQMGITPDMTEAQREEKYREWYISQASKLVPKQEAFEI
jgi:hypothetical protein